MVMMVMVAARRGLQTNDESLRVVWRYVQWLNLVTGKKVCRKHIHHLRCSLPGGRPVIDAHKEIRYMS